MSFEDDTYKKLQYYRKHFDGSVVEKRSTFLLGLNQLATIQLSAILLQKKKRKILFCNVNRLKGETCVKKREKGKYSFFGTRDSNSKPWYQYRITLDYEGADISDISNNDCLNIQRKIKNKNAGVDKTFESGFTFIEVYDEYRSLMSHCNLIDVTNIESFLLKCDEEYSNQPDIKSNIKCDAELQDICSPKLLSSKYLTSPTHSSNLRVINIVMCYLRLLVNIKDEIALSRVIDCPVRGITNSVFSDIRKISQEKSLSMYQTISSFVRQMSLGGKGYAPSENHVFMKAKEGLVDFMELMDKLQNLCDDSMNHQESMKKLLKTLKLCFIRSKVPTFKQAAVNNAIDHLLTKYQEFISFTDLPSQFVFHVQNFVDWMCCHGYDVPFDQLLGVLSTPNTVEKMTLRKIPSLKRQFLTPEAVADTPKRPRIDVKPTNQREVRNFGGFCYQVVENVDENTEKVPTEINVDFNEEKVQSPPSTPIQENNIKLIRCHNTSPLAVAISYSPDNSKKNDAAKPKAFVLLADKENRPVKAKKCARKETKINPKEKPKGKSKKNALLPGQKSIAQFFR